MNGEQLCVVCVQLPLPQLPASVSVDEPLGHDAGAQVVPFAYLWQPPAPSHLPFVEQAGAPLSAHVCFGSIVPAATGMHVPVLPATLQAWHEPQLALPQHTLSTQWPVPHWLSAVQAAPCEALATHAPPVQ
jgi:hypothetical protein